MSAYGKQSEAETRLWATALRRCGVHGHPRNLSPRDQQLQCLLLIAASSRPDQE